MRLRWGSSCVILGLALACLPGDAAAESPAPTVHWGGLAYPDQYPLLSAGLTINRFTEFDNPSRSSVPYGSTVHESFGLNFLSFSWTKQWDRLLPGLSTNLTAGIGPTSEQPSKFLQNTVIHKPFGIPPVQTARVREDTDAMVDGSVTKWLRHALYDGDLFAGGGFSVGTLYQETFLRAGVRRMEVPGLEGAPVRFSMMGRYGHLWPGALIHQIAPNSILWQPVFSFGPYRRGASGPAPWEFELSLTWDSGIFVNGVGQSRKERFWSFSYRCQGVRVETWNDSLMGGKDRGPTYGVTLTYNLLEFHADYEDCVNPPS